MITSFLLYIVWLFVAVITAFFTIFDDVTITANIATNLAAIKPYYSSLDTIFPVTTVLAILVVEVVFESFYLLYKLIRWAYTKVPGIN